MYRLPLRSINCHDFSRYESDNDGQYHDADAYDQEELTRRRDGSPYDTQFFTYV